MDIEIDLKDLKLDDFHRYYPDCNAGRGNPVHRCKDAFDGCTGTCKNFRILLKDGRYVEGAQADELIKKYWEHVDAVKVSGWRDPA
jgi:hypothetical protein